MEYIVELLPGMIGQFPANRKSMQQINTLISLTPERFNQELVAESSAYLLKQAYHKSRDYPTDIKNR